MSEFQSLDQIFARTQAAQSDAAAALIAADPDAFFEAHPDVVTLAHGWAERQRQGATS